MKPPITLSINPWYFCNFRCDFCYLTPAQLGDKERLSLLALDARLTEVKEHYTIQAVDLYGGEPLLLPEEYMVGLLETLTRHDVDDIGINTNLSLVPEWLQRFPDVHISVSFDFEAREKHDRVFMNMLKLDRPFSILMLGSPKLFQHRIEEVVGQLNLLSHLSTVEVKPYSSNQANQLGVSYLDFERFVQSLITSPIEKHFVLMNEVLIEEALNGERNAFSDDHLYITPQGKWAVLEFDRNDDEYFLELDSVEDYQQWCQQERERVARNQFCSACPFYGHCLSEHLREVKDLESSCNGFYHLLKWGMKRYLGVTHV